MEQQGLSGVLWRTLDFWDRHDRLDSQKRIEVAAVVEDALCGLLDSEDSGTAAADILCVRGNPAPDEAGRERVEIESLLACGRTVLVHTPYPASNTRADRMLSRFVLETLWAVARNKGVRGEGVGKTAVFLSEAQEFVCPALAHILLSGEEYNVSLWAEYQYSTQIQPPSVREALLNVGTSAYFRLLDADAAGLAPLIGDGVGAKELTSMRTFSFLLKPKSSRVLECECLPLGRNP